MPETTARPLRLEELKPGTVFRRNGEYLRGELAHVIRAGPTAPGFGCTWPGPACVSASGPPNAAGNRPMPIYCEDDVLQGKLLAVTPEEAQAYRLKGLQAEREEAESEMDRLRFRLLKLIQAEDNDHVWEYLVSRDEEGRGLNDHQNYQ